jgi:hypothetical protein
MRDPTLPFYHNFIELLSASVVVYVGCSLLEHVHELGLIYKMIFSFVI